jgi:hypothetical protein
MPTPVIVVPCAASKRLPSTVGIDGRSDIEVEAWVADVATARAHGPTSPVGALYKGATWAASRRLADANPDSELLVASAGLGLVELTDEAPGYDATFATGSDADIANGLTGSVRSDALRAWWRGLCDHRGMDLAGIVMSRPATTLMVVASGAYLDAMHDDLTRALAVAHDRVVVVGTDANSHPAIADAAVTFDHLVLRRSWTIESAEPKSSGADDSSSDERTEKADPRPTLPRERHDELLAGSLAALGQSVALHILLSVPDLLTVGAAQAAVDRLSEGLREQYVAWSRRPFDDEAQLEAWIVSNAGNATSYTALLRHLRTTGLACEQKRFRDAYRRVVDALPPRTGQPPLTSIEEAA